MPDPTPVGMRLAELITPPVQENPLPNEAAQRRDRVRRNARALDDKGGVREAVEQLVHLQGLSATATHRGDDKMSTLSVKTMCDRALSAFTGSTEGEHK